ncbi:MAG: hypothetical protein INR69_21965, partial [Mucilaginibacter polytrichastri]|nr:hypothetical protein [Mucilaginibacter polytrichastri]
MFYSILIDIAKLAVAGIAVVAAAFAFFKPYFERYVRLKHLDYRKAVTERTTPLKLQAYERLILFLDRINPANMVIRLRDDELTAREFEILMVQEIRQEYQHNVTQQLYVSAEA